MEFTDLTSIIPDLVLDMRYASSNNVCQKKISKYEKPYLLSIVAQGLVKVADKLRFQGYRLVIWDAGRTRETQEYLRAVCGNNKYVAEISKHNCGIAVDVSLADRNGILLDLGTDFDDFSPRAHASNRQFSKEVLDNRQVLFSAMNQAGFKQLPSEWWHFELKDAQNVYTASIRIENHVFA